MTQPASSPSAPTVVGIGETLWDVFPDGAVWGGAPGNVACHAAGLGARSVMVSGVGCDDLGDRGIVALESHGVDCRHVRRDPRHPTGTVTVSLGPAGDASYLFASDTAWDHLAWAPALGDLAAGADAVCFGTLGQRSEESRRTIRRFLEAAGRAVRVFDVNLRQDFHSPGLIRESLALANVLKLNDDELPAVVAACGVTADDGVAAVRQLAERHGLRLAALTRGAAGSVLCADGVVSIRPAEAHAIVDTVGAGDAFTAAVVMGLLGGRPLEAIHDHAARLAAFVCGHRGATPRIPAELRVLPGPPRGPGQSHPS
ncbi:MAG: carbohydrate kinase family protein [Planctomycetia bacterium]